MTCEKRIMASAPDYESACRLAQTLPRPSIIRDDEAGTWRVIRLLPAAWIPNVEHGNRRHFPVSVDRSA